MPIPDAPAPTVPEEVRRQFQLTMRSEHKLAVLERLAPFARDLNTDFSLDQADRHLIPSWEDAGEASRRAWRSLVLQILVECGFFRMLDALENLENDDNAIPPHAWAMVLDAVSRGRGTQPTVEQLQEEEKRMASIYVEDGGWENRTDLEIAKARVRIAKDPHREG